MGTRACRYAVVTRQELEYDAQVDRYAVVQQFTDATRPVVARNVSPCTHDRLSVGGAVAHGYTLVCPDCRRFGTMLVDRWRTRRPSSDAERLLRDWRRNNSADAMARCRHPEYTTRWINKQRDVRCTKCHRDAGLVCDRVIRLSSDASLRA